MERVGIAFVGGLASAVLAYWAAEKFEDPWKAAINALGDAAVLIAIGIVAAGVLDDRATKREQERERRRRERVRAQLVRLLGPNLAFAASGWVHDPDDKVGLAHQDFSVSAGLTGLRGALGSLSYKELDDLHRRIRSEDVDGLGFFSQVTLAAIVYWKEGARRQRLHYMTGIRHALEPLVADADQDVREKFVEFAGALDLAEGASLRTDTIVSIHLVAMPLSPGTPLYGSPGDPLGEPVRSLAASIAVFAATVDSVLHLAMVSHALMRKIENGGELPDSWGNDVRKVLERPIAAVRLEVANVLEALAELHALVAAIDPDAAKRATYAEAARSRAARQGARDGGAST